MQNFRLAGCSLSHGQLLLRSLKTRDRDFNIDIIVKGVEHLLIPTSIDGMEVSKLENEETIIYLKSKFNFTTEYDCRIFLIRDNKGQEYFINALCFGVYHNTLDILETSINRYNEGDFGECQLWYAD